jgi:hypothetical protein
VAAPAPARADVATDVYDDVKNVLVQLVQLHASESAADFVEHASAGLGFYLHDSLDDVRRGQWGGLQEALREDVADLGADYVLWELRNEEKLLDLATSGERGALFRSFLGCFDPAFPREPHAGQCADIRALPGRAHGLRRSSYVYEQCEATTPPPKSGQEFSCDVAMLVRAGLAERADEAHLYAVRALSAATAFLSPSFEEPRRHAASRDGSSHAPLRAWVQDVLSHAPVSDADSKPGESSTAASWPLRTLPGARLRDSLEACRDRPLRAIVDQYVYWRRLKCEPPEPPPPPKGTGAAPRTSPDPQSELDCAVTPEVFEASLCINAQLSVTGDEGACREKTTRVEMEGEDVPAFAGAARAMKCLPAAMRRVMTSVLPPSDHLRCIGHCPYEIFDLASMLGALRDEQSPTSGNWKLDDVSDLVEHGLRMIRARIDALCSGHSQTYAEACNDAPKDPETNPYVVLTMSRYLLPHEANAAEGKFDLHAVLHAALHGQRSQLATVALRSAFDEAFAQGVAGPLDRLFADLVVSVVQFELSDPGDDPANVARDALHAAALRMLDGLANEEGFRRQGLTINPIATLRLSWNGGYRNQSGADGFRYVASVDWPAARMRLTDATAVQITMLDLLAPLSEIALRKQVPTYSNQNLVFLDVLRPRLNLVLGYPTFSRNLTASAGIAFRTITTTTSSDQNGEVLHYTTTLADSFQLVRAIETNLGLSYVF